MKIWPGEPYPLGATWDGIGVNFALFSENATAVELCLFDNPDDERESARIKITNQTDLIWHVYLPEAMPNQIYAYRVYGPYSPEDGHRFNPAKLLLDPYGKALAGDLIWNPALFGYQVGHRKDDLSLDARDSLAFMPKSVVVDPTFRWDNDAPLRTPWSDTIIYECHIRGFTMRHPDIPKDLRGTYEGLASEPAIAYLKSLGVTAVELMPVQSFIRDEHLLRKGLTNYWGYNTICYFAPDSQYAGTGRLTQPVTEFKGMIKTLHREGIEVILDVVYNHTAEGNHLGPTLCFRGIDNASYYRLVSDNPRYYMDYTGCGNSLNMRHPQVLQYVMDSLRYWVTEMHVDGFRFDLAATLARELHEVDRLSAFFDIINQDPVLSQVKLIAEPWDVGDGGYQVGRFPPKWSEWNGKYRDTVRDFWRGQGSTIGEFGYRLTGSADLYETTGRRPTASINFITAHDGFTLRDLVSYNEKHNEANGENNNDGSTDNRSWNCGEEGPTENAEITELRDKQERNLLATLLLSQGVPMLHHGDEIGHTKSGNNNTYCQDNALNWLNWQNADERLLEFTKKLIQLRLKHPVFRRQLWFHPARAAQLPASEIGWFRPSGEQMQEQDWEDNLAFGFYLNGRKIRGQTPKGEPITDDSFCFMINAYHEDVDFRLPPADWGGQWVKELDTNEPVLEDAAKEILIKASEPIRIAARSLMVLRYVE